MLCHGELCREAPGSVRKQRDQAENVGRSLYWGFHGEEQGRQGEQAEDWLVLRIPMGPGALELSSVVVPGPGVMRAGR